MALPDDNPEKWKYHEHTKVKHELLEKYLRGWICILGGYYTRICFFDCFAGRGTYVTEEKDNLGSPLRALRLAKRMKKNYDKFVFTFIERNPNNYKNLVEELKKEGWDDKKITIKTYNDTFSNVAGDILDYFKKNDLALAPSFFFIDPFGYKGIPFSVVKDILSFKRTEILFTFMTKIGRAHV